MKLYATVSSERASKGQGGNEYLRIELKGEAGEVLAVVRLWPHATEDYSKYLLQVRAEDDDTFLYGTVFDKKGKKQEGKDVICADRQCTIQEHKHSWMR